MRCISEIDILSLLGSCALGRKSSVVDPDPHSFGSPGSGSVLELRIWILDHGNLPKLIKKLDFLPFQKGLCTVGYLRRYSGMFVDLSTMYRNYLTFIFHVKIQPFLL